MNLRGRLKRTNKDVISIKCDISEKKEIEKMANDVIEKFEVIDVLINLAAIDAKFDKNPNEIDNLTFEDFPLDKWKTSIDVNVTGTFIVTQAVIKQMLKAGKGNIINVASTYSLVAPTLQI